MSIICTLTSAEKEKVEFYQKELKKRLREKRYHHSLCVADAAVELSRRYGYADEKKAYFAGLLHDITKQAEREEHFAIMARGGYTPTPLEAGQEKLWHAKTGALLLQLDYGITDGELLDAVRYHTTARAGMRPLEEILYLADFISEDRDYDDVEEMRRAARTDKREAMTIALSYTIQELVQKGSPIHPDTVEAYNELFVR